MRTKILISGIALATGLVAGGAFLVPALAQTAAEKPAAAAESRLTMAQIHDRLAAAGYTSIDKIERERDRYEVKATDRDGRRVELYVDAATARVMKSEVKRERRDDDRRDRSDGQSRN